MSSPVLHSSSGLDLPLSPELGRAFLAVGVLVLLIIAYDVYRNQSLEGEN